MLKETLLVLNPWWKTGKVSKELSKPYKRKAFQKLLDLLEYRHTTIISGLRRVGKTTLMYQAIEFLLKRHNPLEVMYFNFDKGAENLTELLNMYSELTKLDWKKNKVYVFLDEIVKLKSWPEEIKLLYDAFPNLKFVLSSSSSVGLERDAMSNLAGRHFMINLKPLEFEEYLELRGKEKLVKNPGVFEEELKKEFERYLMRSFPEIVDWEDENLIKDYLKSMVIDKVIKVDIAEKFRNINKNLLFQLLNIFYSEPGAMINLDSLSRELRISKKTLINHIFYLEFSYLIRKVKNFRPSTFATSRKMQKVYAYWWNLLYCYTENKDKIMENFVASTLDTKYYWRKGRNEVDFLAGKKKELIPVEVKNRERVGKESIRGLLNFLKKYPTDGYVIYNGEKKRKFDEKKLTYLPFWKIAIHPNLKS